jgi:Tfp pilus assembly protein PilN
MRAVNLIPSDDRRGGGGVGLGEGRSQGAAYGVLALLAGLAVLALVYGLARHQVSSRRTQLATVAARAQRVQEAATALSSYTSFDALREQRIKAVDELVDSRFDWAHTLHELGRVMPSGTSITTLTGAIAAAPAAGAGASPPAAAAAATSTATTSTAASATPGASGSGAAAAGSVSSATPPGSVPTMTLGGCATSQATLAQTLERLRLIDGVSKVALQSSVKPAATATAAGAGAAGSSAGCAGSAAFSVELTFQALPAVSPTGKGGAELTSSSTGGER